MRNGGDVASPAGETPTPQWGAASAGSSAAPCAEKAVIAERLHKTYGKGERIVHALAGVTFTIERGERVALLGKSGSGKSTLLHLIGGLDHATSGSLYVAGQNLAELSARELTRFRSSTVGMIFQGFNLIPSRTALQNVELPMIFAGRPPAQRRADARRALEAVGLGARLHHRPTELSGGESQRVAIARALVNRPQILLADEPTGNLDSATAREVMSLMLDHVSAHGTTLVLVTHDEELARSCTQRVLRLADGVINSK
jgi:ABC-type lipoprotein export system ATPase subunit